MPKSDLPIGGEYAPVADRIVLFYERYPEGRIVTQLTMHNEREIVFCASVYRDQKSRVPAATGWASERVGDGDINTVACLENTETSAIGRALANLGFIASRQRPSAEEMAKAVRARARTSTVAPYPESSPSRRVRESALLPIDADPLQRAANEIMETLGLIATAEAYGMRAARATTLRERITSGNVDTEVLARIRQLLRGWLAKHRGPRPGKSGSEAS